MDKYLADVKYFAEKHSNNGSGLIAELKSYFNKVIGAAFQIRVINTNNESRAKFNGARFDASIADDGNEDDLGNTDAIPDAQKPSKGRYDISTGSGPGASGLNLYEFKSWGQNTKTAFMASSNTRAKFANQLKAYFRNDNISTLSRLHYYFDGRTGRLSQNDAKEIIQKVLQENAQSWFASNDPLIVALVVKLKLLFGVIDEITFLAKINDLNNEVFDFVKAIN